jgi:hypothetical protein
MKYFLTHRIDSACPTLGIIIEIWKSTDNINWVDYVCGSNIYPMRRVDGFVRYDVVKAHIIKESEDVNELIESAAVLCL